MAKYIILGDTHLACKNGSGIYSKHQQKFFDHVLFPYIRQTGYSILQMGDLFDQRKFVNFVGLEAAFEGFFDRLEVPMVALLGNHDISYRETLRVNAPELLLGAYPDITIIKNPTTVDGIDFIPWICDENRDEINTFIQKSKSKICCGHFEIAGFSMQRGVPSHGGLDIKMFDKYKLVLSGHYHTRSTNCNITYVGTPYELTWSDYNDAKGFHVLDTDTCTIEFVENPHTLYATIVYDDRNPFTIIHKPDYYEKYVKVIVVHKSDYYAFDQFIAQVNSCGAYDVKIVENYSDRPIGEVGEEILLKNTLEVLNSYIESMKTDNPGELNNYMKSLYVQAQEVL